MYVYEQITGYASDWVAQKQTVLTENISQCLCIQDANTFY